MNKKEIIDLLAEKENEALNNNDFKTSKALYLAINIIDKNIKDNENL